jgi:hypothetical protein
MRHTVIAALCLMTLVGCSGMAPYGDSGSSEIDRAHADIGHHFWADNVAGLYVCKTPGSVDCELFRGGFTVTDVVSQNSISYFAVRFDDGHQGYVKSMYRPNFLDRDPVATARKTTEECTQHSRPLALLHLDGLQVIRVGTS